MGEGDPVLLTLSALEGGGFSQARPGCHGVSDGDTGSQWGCAATPGGRSQGGDTGGGGWGGPTGCVTLSRALDLSVLSSPQPRDDRSARRAGQNGQRQ